ncbi:MULTISPECIES: aspartate kinase [unclassified Synechocystis]|uniref:aspartate kinase n=1 Tax=unclassified Synechocystis TaxID=2640012 RepID=UPI0004074AE0|nr:MULTISPECIES: aspartate kinase [unclassified Synechocystis]AIE73180.1 Aspartokinase [Synechocystis sp. PCC 6714]MCT0254305.1 aspartate kinase [Synechocystis sp. CS-94]
MALIVQKFGGTSVGTVERIQAVAQRIKSTVQGGNSLVVVVSAMGKSTDVLVDLAQQISPNPCRREMDMLLSTGEQVSIALLSLALQEIDQPAISLTGAQVGIVTEAEHSRARILEIRPDRLERHLQEGKVVVVAGFQGISSVEHLEITTLGRGGSDTSAVALAAALKADFCEIYTDVPGILTTDPRLVPEAQLMAEITCDEMLELASLGAKVLHPRAVEIARNYGIPLVVRSSWSDEPGTRVVAPPVQNRSLVGLEIAKAVDGVEYDADQAKVALLRVPDRPGVAARLFRDISQQQVDIDLIIQSIHDGNSNDIAFTVVKDLLGTAEAITSAIAPALRSYPEADQEAEIIVEKGIAKIAIAGAGMIGRPGIAAKMFKTLADVGVNIEMISTSEVKVSCVIDQRDADRAIAALSNAFGVTLSPPKNQTDTSHLPAVRGVALDQDQAQIAIRHVPDRPGMAAQLFTALAEANISVDMIIQSQRCRINQGTPCRDIAFMVAEGDSSQAEAILQPLVKNWPDAAAVVNKAIAKVSIVGSGMIGHPGVAAHFFAALAQENINIEMIATSEIKISCVVPQERGVDALKAAHSAFNLAGTKTVTVPA